MPVSANRYLRKLFFSISNPPIKKDKDRGHGIAAALVLSLDYSLRFDKMRVSQDRRKKNIGQEA